MDLLKLKLLKTLVLFNFYFLNSKINLSKIKNYETQFYKKKINLNFIKKKPVLILNLFEILKQIKQTIKILQYLNKKKNSKLEFYGENFFFTSILEKESFINNLKIKDIYFKKNLFNQKLFFSIIFNLISTKKDVYLKYFSKNSLIINNLHKTIIKNNFGSYKIHSDFLSDWKKTVFLLLLLKKFYAKNTKV